MTAAPLTPKEFAAEVFGGKRSARWVSAQCALWIRSKGKRGIAVVDATARFYLIPAAEAERFRVPFVFARAVKVA